MRAFLAPPGAKRAMDLLGASGLLILAFPLLAATAVAVVVTSGRPIFFRQVRVGRRGRDFVILKFRTMSVAPDAYAGRFDAGNTSRVTRFGRFLRRTKLDELPQIWNVLRGDMSLVGPRPEIRKWVEAYPREWAIVHRMRPGITDPASIEFRNEEDILARADDPDFTYRHEILPRKLSYYQYYVRHWTLLGDIYLWYRTLFALTFRLSQRWTSPGTTPGVKTGPSATPVAKQAGTP